MKSKREQRRNQDLVSEVKADLLLRKINHNFDERFKQLWLFYLSYCEAGFRTGRTNVVQLELAKPA